MNTEYVLHASNRPVKATVSNSTEDLTALDPQIALHGDNDTADVWLDAEWETVTATDGVAVTSASVNFAAMDLGQYLVRVKLAGEPQDAYRIKLIP